MQTENRFKEYFTQYYATAQNFAKRFRSVYLDSGAKEEIASDALVRAIKTFDENKGSFQNWLWKLIQNDLKTAVVKAKQHQLFVRDYDDTETGERKDIFELLDVEEKPTDLTHYNTITQKLKLQLTQRQQQLLDMLQSPLVYLEKYNLTYKPKKLLKKLNYEAIGKMLDLSIGSITYELKKIQTLTKEVLKNIKE